MRKILFSLIFFTLLTVNIFAQDKEVQKLDEFGRIPCGDFMARMDAIFVEFKNNPNSKIYVIHYGGRFRRIYSDWNQEERRYNKLKLEFTHRMDGINWAKSIPLFLTTYSSYPIETRNLLKDKILLVNGGFRENTEVEIWIVPTNSESPKPTPTLIEKDIRFRIDKPYGTPNFATCYDGL